MKNSLTISSAVLAGILTFAITPALQAEEAKIKLVTMLPAKHPVGKSFGGFIK